jgi:c(7)-type cytochrome triheme protein
MRRRAYTRTPTDSPAYRIAFSHGEHGARQRLNCSDCHSYTPRLAQRRQVSSPRAQEHFPAGNNSCATCHNGRRAFGGDLDFQELPSLSHRDRVSALEPDLSFNEIGFDMD